MKQRPHIFFFKIFPLLLSFAVVFCFSTLFIELRAQKHANVWCFGYNTIIDFNSGLPQISNESQMATLEGCASIADPEGGLLFYTNGKNVWSRNHQIMEEGSGLSGHVSSTQSAIIVPLPKSDSIYYIFTSDELGGDNGLSYSIINIKKNDGLGKVMRKNKKLYSPVQEKLTAVMHSNQSDYWIISHEWGGNAFLAYKLISDGLIEQPVVSNVGIDYDHYTGPGNTVGYVKVSPDGKKIALTRVFDKLCELFDFNDKTGIISGAKRIICPFDWPYGCEFSPDGSKLYISTLSSVLQYDIELQKDNLQILDYQLVETSVEEQFAGIQLGPDGKIYIAKHPPHLASQKPASKYLSVIHRPNEPSTYCGFVFDGLFLKDGGSQSGLPMFVQSWFKEPEFYVRNFCFVDTTFFRSTHFSSIDSVLWDFGDLKSSVNTSKDTEPYHVFANAGDYLVKQYFFKNGIKDSLQKVITINPLPDFSIGNDTVVCGEKNFDINLAYNNSQKNGDNKVFWNDVLSNDLTKRIDESQKTYVRIINSYGCSATDSVFVQFFDNPEPPVLKDTAICNGDSARYIAPEGFKNYNWSNLDTSQMVYLHKESNYQLMITDENNCKASSEFNLIVNHPPQIEINMPDDLCNRKQVEISFEGECDDFVWGTGEKTPTIIVSKSGDYSIEASNQCGKSESRIKIEFEVCEPQIPNVLTPNIHFYIRDMGDLQWELSVYNRWGYLVYENENYQHTAKDSSNPDKVWKGKNKSGRTLASGVYYYILQNKEYNKTHKGTVHVFN